MVKAEFLEIFLKIILAVLVFLIIIVLVSILQISQNNFNNYMVPELKQNCISLKMNIESMNIDPSIKEAAINAIDSYLLCQNLTKSNTT